MYNCNFSEFVIEGLLIKGYLLTYLLFIIIIGSRLALKLRFFINCRMKKELKKICLSITMTKKQMAETEGILSKFRAEEAEIEHQLALMDHDSAIDTNECMSLRQEVCIDGKDPLHLYHKKWTD